MEFDLDEATAVLARTPAAAKALLQGLPEGWVNGDEGPDTWSPFAAVGHLIHGERTDWIARAKIILTMGESKAFDPFDRFAQFEESQGKSMEELLHTFEELRGRNLESLRGLGISEEDLKRKGRHPALGTVTLGQLLSTWVAHDLGHLAQIARVMARQYSDQVGPWREYIPILGS